MPQYNDNLSLNLMESEGLSCQDGLNEPPLWIRVEGKDIIKPTETMFEQEFQ